LAVTGDLTVDTTTLKVDSTNNRVGIGISSPSTALDVVGTTTLKTVKAGSGVVAISSATYTSLYATSTYNTSTPHGFATGDTVAVTGITPSSWNRTATITVNSPTQFFFSLFDGSTGGAYSSGGTATGPPSTLYVDTTNDRIGIGTSSPATKLDVLGTATVRAAATQDGVALAGRAGGTSTYEVTLTPTTLTADRTLTLPDASGTVALTDSAMTSSTFIGTTSVALNRSSGALTLAGITLTTPVLGVATATTINKVAFTAPATGSTLTIAEGKTLTASNTLTLTGTDASSVAFGAGGTVAYTNVATLSSLTSIGTIGTGIWQGTAIAGLYGGTGVANSGKTITLGGNLTTSGAFATTLTATAATTVTLPTSGTLATTTNVRDNMMKFIMEVM
jgi:hypothetical protein